VARSRAEPTDPAVVLDFGHSAVKRGLAHFDRGQLSSVHLLPNAPVGLTPETAAPEEVMVLVEQMLAETVATAQRWCTRLDARLVVSVASYVRGGQPWDPRGLYAPLRLRPPGGVQSYVHDGTAAARGLRAPGQAAALILLGTSLGVGFPPPPASLVPLASDFAVV
jgi:hypothetical protein